MHLARKGCALVACCLATSACSRLRERLSSYLARPIDTRPPSWRWGQGVDVGDGFLGKAGAPAPLADSDGDGMPDAWERANGVDPLTRGRRNGRPGEGLRADERTPR